MWYNHAKAEAVFKQEWTQKEHICRENGMTDAQIQELYDLEREIFNSDRRFYEHCEMNDKLLSQMQQQAITETYDAFNWILVLPSETQQRLIIPPLGTHQSATRKTVIRIKERTNPKRGTHQSAQGTHLPLRS